MEKILVIDDEPAIRILLRQLFEQAGYEVYEASDGKQGIFVYKKENPDLVITDLIMPNEEGLDVIKNIKKIRPGAKIIAISGGGIGSAQLYLTLAKRMGASHVFEKPFAAQEVLTISQSLLAS
ncbi:MAG: response regulator [Pseudomonadota bacterium]